MNGDSDARTSNPKITYSEASDRFYYDWNGVIRPATEREIAGAMERLAAFEHEHDALLRGRIPTHRCKICGALWILWPAGTAGMAEASWSLFSLRCGQCCDCAPMLEQIEPLPRLGGSAPETGGKRAYYETHEPPHCPTCECGRPPADACSCGRVELKDGYVRASCADGSVHTKAGCNSPLKASAD